VSAPNNNNALPVRLARRRWSRYPAGSYSAAFIIDPRARATVLKETEPLAVDPPSHFRHRLAASIPVRPDAYTATEADARLEQRRV
jgi:hypothetical protein